VDVKFTAMQAMYASTMAA